MGTDSIIARRDRKQVTNNKAALKKDFTIKALPTHRPHSESPGLSGPLRNLWPEVQLESKVRPHQSPQRAQLWERKPAQPNPIRAASGPIPAPASLPSPHSNVHRHPGLSQQPSQGHPRSRPLTRLYTCLLLWAMLLTWPLRLLPPPQLAKDREKRQKPRQEGQGSRPSWTDTEAIRYGLPQSMDLLGQG